MESTAISSSDSPAGLDDRSNPPIPAHPKLGDTSFQYQPLDPTKSEIRLLHIQPGKYEHDIECGISHVLRKRRKSSKFKAISYAWGDPEDTCLIQLDGHQFPVHRSLWGVLRALRSEHHAVSVWADAVCINQSDVIERGLQVQNMAGIYATASETALWLGPQQDDSNLGFDLINKLRLNLDPHERSLAIIFNLKPRLEALVHLFERAYWNRLWCVQELWNARAVVVYCGHHKTPLRLCQVFQRFVALNTEVFEQHLPHRSRNGQPWTDVLNSRGPATMDAECCRARISLPNALLTNCLKLCIDPRDRLYAIPSLLGPEVYFPISGDYSASVRDVFTGIVIYDVKCTSNLDIICGSTPTSQNRFSLPSWVPDWTARERLGPLGALSDFGASGISTAVATFTDNRSKLHVSAIKIDDIEDVLDKVPETGDISEVFFAISSWRSHVSQKVGNDPEIRKAFLRTLAIYKDDINPPSVLRKQNYYFWDQNPKNSQRHDLLELGLEIYSWSKPENVDNNYPYEAWPEEMRINLPGRQFSLTTVISAFCLSVGDVRQGDQIFVLLGCSVPVVLRKLQGCEYQYIGEIYVDGYMHGRAMKESEEGMRKVETITLV